MAAPDSPARKRLLRVLSDRSWHQREDLIADAAKAVPPGQAWRAAENDRQRRSGAPRQHADDALTVSVGARSIARRTLNHLIRRGDVETAGDLVRLR